MSNVRQPRSTSPPGHRPRASTLPSADLEKTKASACKGRSECGDLRRQAWGHSQARTRKISEPNRPSNLDSLLANKTQNSNTSIKSRERSNTLSPASMRKLRKPSAGSRQETTTTMAPRKASGSPYHSSECLVPRQNSFVLEEPQMPSANEILDNTILSCVNESLGMCRDPLPKGSSLLQEVLQDLNPTADENENSHLPAASTPLPVPKCRPRARREGMVSTSPKHVHWGHSGS